MGEEENNLDEFKEEDHIQLGHKKGDGILVLYDAAKLVKAPVSYTHLTLPTKRIV